MSTLNVGDIYEINYPREGVDRWRRVRIVSDDGKAVWVRMANIIGNSFPVARSDLRPLSSATPISRQ